LTAWFGHVTSHFSRLQCKFQAAVATPGWPATDVLVQSKASTHGQAPRDSGSVGVKSLRVMEVEVDAAVEVEGKGCHGH